MKYSLNLQNFGSYPVAAAGGTLTLRPQLGLTYHSITLDCLATANTAAITEIRVVINTQIMQRYRSFADLNNMLNFMSPRNALASNTRYVIIPFDRNFLLTEKEQSMTALYTGVEVTDATGASVTGVPVSTFSIEIDFDNTYVGGGSIVATGEVSNLVLPALLLKRVPNQFSVSATGTTQIQDIQKGDDIVMIELQNADITAVRIFQNQQKNYDRTTAYNTLYQQRYQRTPAAGVFRIDPSEEGYGTNIISTRDASGRVINSFYIEFDISTPVNSINCPVTYLSTLTRG